MKIDKEKLRALAEKSDEELWSTIKAVAESHGIKVPIEMPSHDDMEKLRAAMKNANRSSLATALKIIDKYRKGGS